MSTLTVSTSFGSVYSFSDLINGATYDGILDLIDVLTKLIKEFNVSKLNKIEFAKDLFEFKIDNFSLEDCFLQTTNNDYSAAYNLLNEFQKSVASNVSIYLETQEISNQIATSSLKDFPYKYSFSFCGQWIPLTSAYHVKSYSDVCSHNSLRFPTGISNEDEFTMKAKYVYEHIEFHEDFSNTLKTVRLGKFLNYLEVFSHALNTLNQASLKVSNDQSKNDDDLVVIRNVSSDLGKTLPCSGEAKNKPHFDFPKEGDPNTKESVNCEYHLKLNTDKSGKNLSTQHVNRAYFGLKYSPILNKKKIKLAHLGCHL